jgi:hypothetical protein
VNDTQFDARRAQIYEELSLAQSGVADAVATYDEGLKSIVQRVIDCWHRWWAVTEGPRPQHQISQPLDRKFRLCFPLAAHALNHVEHAFAAQRRLPWVAASGVRIAFEHALTAQWILLTEAGEDDVKAEMDSAAFVRREKLLDGIRALSDRDESVANAHGLSDGDLEHLIGERPPKKRANFEQVCQRFASREMADLFYDISRSLSEAVHPSFGLIGHHLTFDGEWNPRGIDWRGSSGEVVDLSRSMAVSALWALYVIEVCRDGQPHAQEVRDIGERVGLPVDLRSSDQHPDRHPVNSRYWV